MEAYVFPSLSSDLREDFKRVLVQIKDKVISHPYDKKRTVIIEGHSDNEPIKPDQPYHKNPNIKAIEVWGTNGTCLHLEHLKWLKY